LLHKSLTFRQENIYESERKTRKLKKKKKPVRSKASLLRDYSITTSWFIFFFDPFIIEEEQQEKKNKTLVLLSGMRTSRTVPLLLFMLAKIKYSYTIFDSGLVCFLPRAV
jgi:hypothetical protein